MNYMLPLYLDYLERPKIYEGVFYKELGIIEGKITEDVIIRIRTKIAEALKKGSYNPKAGSTKWKEAYRKLYRSGKSKPENMKLQASHTTDVKRKIADLKALKNKTIKLAKTKTAKQLGIERKIKDLQALNKKTYGITPAGKKTAISKLSKAGKKLAIAAQQTSKVTPVAKKTIGAKAGTLLKTAKSVGGKAAMVAGGAAAAYGGYKLYKRHLSKAAQKCKGKSGAERTLCLQQQTRD